MSELDVSTWKKFRIGDLFEVEKHGKSQQVPTGGMIAKNLLVDGTTPRITVTGTNNGVIGYYADIEDKNYRVYENFISVSFLGTVFYHSGRASFVFIHKKETKFSMAIIYIKFKMYKESINFADSKKQCRGLHIKARVGKMQKDFRMDIQVINLLIQKQFHIGVDYKHFFTESPRS